MPTRSANLTLPPPLAPALDKEAAYRALQTHDARFDGRLYVGVTSTGIYCRPICRVRLPKQDNCRFFLTPARAEAAGFRPCLRCRPELAPGLARVALVDSSRALAQAGTRLLELALDRGEAVQLPAVAARLGVTDRHFRRIFQAEHGVSPIQWLGTRRLLRAKQLLTDTPLPIAQVALAAGFSSLRRFNTAFRDHYRMAPQALRGPTPARPASDTLRLFLPWRPPYDRAGMNSFLRARLLGGVEAWHDDHWWHTLTLANGATGWLGLQLDARREGAWLALSNGLLPALPQVLRRIRHLLDLDAQPQDIAQTLGPLAASRPGLRVPGCLDGFETTVRIILGQQVSVAAATTLAARLVEALGAPCSTSVPGLDRLFPSPQALRDVPAERLGSLGLVRTRVTALQALARAVTDDGLDLSPDAAMDSTLARLRALPGVGAWTCEMVALRVLAWPDAFPARDAGVLRALAHLTPQTATIQAEAWHPWRSYAVMHLWQGLDPARDTTFAPSPLARPHLHDPS